jgi:yeast amino acid transporter
MPDYIASAAGKGPPNYNEKNEEAQIRSSDSESMSVKAGDNTHRQLRPRHIQLIDIGSTIGTALYVQIGHGLINGGPASLFMAFTIWYV